MNHHLLVPQQQKTQQQTVFGSPPSSSTSPSASAPSTSSPNVYLKNVGAWNVDTLKEISLNPPSVSITRTSPSTSSTPLPVVYLKNVCAWNVDTLKELHLSLFPVHYSDSFYQQVQNVGEFAKVVYLDDQAVGAICCRIEPELQQQGKYRVYIMTLGVLEPYRRQRLGHILLQHVVNQAQLEPTITRIYLHVQTLNTPALAFYHRHGFEKVALARDYYRHIPDKDAYVVVKNITHGDPSS